ncbi:hypothetical protein C2S52_009517 [Perilla frutescens var. hirtella]|nr:hypothetical protein C2S52_009517 [Perilla frutescens var. hirtella]
MDFKSISPALVGTQRSVYTTRKIEPNDRWNRAALILTVAGTQRPLECHHRQGQRPLGSGDGWGARFQLLTGRWDTALAGFSKSIEISCLEVGFHPS